MNDTKFCLNCGGLFERRYNRYFEEVYKDKDFCSSRCERMYQKKEKRRAEKSAPRHGALA